MCENADNRRSFPSRGCPALVSLGVPCSCVPGSQRSLSYCFPGLLWWPEFWRLDCLSLSRKSTLWGDTLKLGLLVEKMTFVQAFLNVFQCHVLTGSIPQPESRSFLFSDWGDSISFLSIKVDCMVSSYICSPKGKNHRAGHQKSGFLSMNFDKVIK